MDSTEVSEVKTNEQIEERDKEFKDSEINVHQDDKTFEVKEKEILMEAKTNELKEREKELKEIKKYFWSKVQQGDR